jgi:7,8-dihydro-6-hydroxymethylpterin-pyrophosphokinase
MTNNNARVKITNDEVTRIVRIAWEMLTKKDIEEVFGKAKAEAWFDGKIDFVILWYYATAIEQADLLEIMNDRFTNQSFHLSRNEEIV